MVCPTPHSKAPEQEAVQTSAESTPTPRKVVFWVDEVGHRGEGSPVAADVAEELRAEYQRRHPGRRYGLRDAE